MFVGLVQWPEMVKHWQEIMNFGFYMDDFVCDDGSFVIEQVEPTLIRKDDVFETPLKSTKRKAASSSPSGGRQVEEEWQDWVHMDLSRFWRNLGNA